MPRACKCTRIGLASLPQHEGERDLRRDRVVLAARLLKKPAHLRKLRCGHPHHVRNIPKDSLWRIDLRRIFNAIDLFPVCAHGY